VHAEIDFVDAPQLWSQLGHDFRVVVHITSWRSEQATTVPVTALFRQGDDWAVFVVEEGRARARVVKINHRNSRMAEVEAGLVIGDQVVLHPSDRVGEGVAVAEREVR
jgi:HlyD family secretion protein